MIRQGQPDERDYRPLRAFARQLLTQEEDESFQVLRPFYPARRPDIPKAAKEPHEPPFHQSLPEKEPESLPSPPPSPERPPIAEKKKLLRPSDGPAFEASNLQYALKQCRENHPLPKEMQLAQKPAYRSWLLGQLRRCDTQKSLSDFAFSLDNKDLATLFPALATLKQGEAVDRLISLIMMRASHYLYVQGWLTLQYSYPRFTVQKALAEVCAILETPRQRDHAGMAAPSHSPYDFVPSSEERFDWYHLPLISEISMPNTRHFLAAIVRYILETKIPGEDFYHRYGLYRDLPLGRAISSEWDMAMFEGTVNYSHYAVRRLFSENISPEADARRRNRGKFDETHFG